MADSLKDLLTRSILPQEWFDKIDAPTADRSPLEAQLRGFVAGAAERATAPDMLASAAMPLAGKAVGAMGAMAPEAAAMSGDASAVQKLLAPLLKQGAGKPTMAMARPAPQRVPEPQDVERLIQRFKSRMGEIPSSGQ
jgi:hypothetical protein